MAIFNLISVFLLTKLVINEKIEEKRFGKNKKEIENLEDENK